MLTLSFSLAYLGLSALSLSLPRHYRDLRGAAPSPAMVLGLRLAGYPLAALSIWPCIAAYSPSVGIIIWLGMLPAGAFSLVGVMAWKPRFAIVPGLCVGLLAIICLGLHELRAP